MIDDLATKIRTRVTARIEQTIRVARQRYALEISKDQASSILSHFIASPLRFGSLLSSDDVADDEIGLMIVLTRAKAPQLFQLKEPA